MSLYVVANGALRITSGALKTTPVSSLQVMNSEAPLELRRAELLLKYYYKMKCHLQSPAFGCVINDNLYKFFNNRRIKSPAIVRIQHALQLYDIPIQPVLTFKTPIVCSHNLMLPQIDLDIVGISKNDTPHRVVRAIFRSLIDDKYDGHQLIFTDGSKSGEGVGSAAIMGVNKETVSLPRVSTVFTAEVIALRLAARLVRNSSADEKYLVCSDSLSALQEMKNVLTYDHLVHRVQLEFHEIITSGYDVTLTWVPSHVGIQGNENVDAEARQASLRPPEFIPIPFRNWFPEIRRRAKELWTQQWRTEGRDFYELKPTLQKWAKTFKLSRREEVIINRLRLGHTRVTHGYLFDYEGGFIQQPMCRWCEVELLSIRHMLLECPVLQDVRENILKSALGEREVNIRNLIGEGGVIRNVIAYLREIGVYDEI